MTNKTPLWLRAANEEELALALPFARGVDHEENEFWITGTHEYALELLGVLQRDTGESGTDENGHTYPLREDITGFHANILCTAEIAALIPQEVRIPEPNDKQRTWAGW